MENVERQLQERSGDSSVEISSVLNEHAAVFMPSLTTWLNRTRTILAGDSITRGSHSEVAI